MVAVPPTTPLEGRRRLLPVGVPERAPIDAAAGLLARRGDLVRCPPYLLGVLPPPLCCVTARINHYMYSSSLESHNKHEKVTWLLLLLLRLRSAFFSTMLPSASRVCSRKKGELGRGFGWGEIPTALGAREPNPRSTACGVTVRWGNGQVHEQGR